MANGLAIDFVRERERENGRWRGNQKVTSGRGQGGRLHEGPLLLDNTASSALNRPDICYPVLRVVNVSKLPQ